MIEGLKVTVSGETVKDLALEHAAFHDSRATFYERRIAAFEPDTAEPMKMSGTDPMAQYEARVKQHKTASQELRFFAKHVDQSEVFLLARADLHHLGIVESSY